MKAVYLDSVQKLSLKELPVPTIRDDQVLVQIKAVGVCGSDIHYWHKGKIGPFVVEAPMILGHESAGVVEAVGERVTHLKVGDRVVIEPGVPCFKCAQCLHGRYNICPDILFFATPPVDGALVEHVAYDASLVFKIPEGIRDFGLATMSEPLAVGVFATHRVQPQPGEKVIVFGAGVIGIACMLAAKAVGVASVTVADIRDDRLEKAKEMGADEIINLSAGKLPHQFYDVAFEASGAESCYAHASHCMKTGSKIAMVGMGPDMQTIPLVDFICREVSLIPSFRYGNAYPQALDLLDRHKDKLVKLITHRMPFSLEGSEQALQTAHSDPSAGKVIIDF